MLVCRGVLLNAFETALAHHKIQFPIVPDLAGDMIPSRYVQLPFLSLRVFGLHIYSHSLTPCCRMIPERPLLMDPAQDSDESDIERAVDSVGENRPLLPENGKKKKRKRKFSFKIFKKYGRGIH